MSKFVKVAQQVQNYKQDERGAFSIMFAVSALTLIMAAGVAYDTNRLLSTKSRAQLTSDSIGLVASIYVKNNGQSPKSNSDGFVHNRWYDAKTAGVDFGAATASGNAAKFKVVYDSENAQAVVHVSAEMRPSFMNAFGVSKMTFNSKSVVKYAQSDVKDPASVFLVMDNSGSMGWGDKIKPSKNGAVAPGTQRRITGLKSTVKEFNDYLGAAVAPDPSNPDKKFLRMGMTAYSSGLISSRTVNPMWGTLPTVSINAMVAGGGTDSRQSMAKARTWMQGEGVFHKAMNGTDKPLKYVIFMTDGVNNQQYVCEWTNKNGTGYWRKKKKNGQYKYKWSWKKPKGKGWVQGEESCSYKSVANDQTLQTCTAMKNEGVEIYTIGYALEPGTYPTNPPNSWGTTTQNQTTTDTAYNFLRSCASSADHFVKAEDTEGLKDAFDKIGADIATDIIRIAS